MSELKTVEIPGEPSAHRQSGALANQRTKVLSNTECPSCLRKGTMEVFIRKHGEYTFCFSCGHRETSFYS